MSTNLPAQQDKATISQSFIAKVKKQYAAELGSMLAWSGLESTLAQHLFLKIDASLTDAQAKGTDVHWGNVNMAKLAIDAPHIVALGLDGCIKNHINVIPYFNAKKKMYDLRISPGYEGEALSRVQNSVYPVVDHKEFLLYKGDVFIPRFSSLRGDDFDYIPANVLNPGDASMVEGGFGFVTYDDPRRNKLRIVTMDEFKRSESSGGPLWRGQDRKAMMLKTVVWRTVEEIQLDPAKVNSFRHMMTMSLDEAEGELQSEIAQHANKGLITMPAPSSLGGGITTTGPSTDKEDDQEPRGAHNADAGDLTPQPEPQDPATGAAEPEAAEETQEQAKPATAPKKRLILSKEQTEEMTARLAKIPDAATPPMFKAACERDGLDWAGVQARLSEIEAGEAARQPF